MREHHALGIAGRARGIDDRGEIDVDACSCGRSSAVTVCNGVIPALGMGQRGQLRVIDGPGDDDAL